MIYVFDASFITALIIPDEKNPIVDSMYAKIENEDMIYSPFLIWYEITNVFMNLLRRKRFTIDEVMHYYPRLAAIKLIIDYETGVDYSKKLLFFCSKYILSSYDASYLELAERKKAILCTLDKNLKAAAKKSNVPVME